jgi:hypothetical protein
VGFWGQGHFVCILCLLQHISQNLMSCLYTLDLKWMFKLKRQAHSHPSRLMSKVTSLLRWSKTASLPLPESNSVNLLFYFFHSPCLEII